MTILTFELKLLSDYHVGSGHRGGPDVDSALLREVDGRPALRGSVLGQMMRDAACSLMQTPVMHQHSYARCGASGNPSGPEYCGQWQADNALCPICQVFGSPRRPRHWSFTSAWLAEGIARDGFDIVSDKAAQPVMRVRVSPRTRRAEPNKLFSEEVGDGRLVFRFAAQWRGPGSPDESEIAFLAAAARNFRHIGKGRRRGRGTCLVRLVEVDGAPIEHDWLDLFRRNWLDDQWQPPAASMSVKWQTAPVISIEPTARSGDALRVRIVARLDEPLLIARRAEAGNEFEGISVVPGNVLLGALAARAATRVNLGDALTYEAFAGLFRRGWARFSFLHLAEWDDEFLYPAYAVPLDVFRCKRYPLDHRHTRHPDHSYALDSAEVIECRECTALVPSDADMEGLEGFEVLQSGERRAYTPSRREEMHIRTNPTTQRARTGDLFGYVPIEANQYAVGEIICRHHAAWEALVRLADLPADGERMTLRLGKATRRGYGQITMVLEPIDDPGAAQKSVLPPLVQRLPDPLAPISLLLATDAIVVDPWGRFPNGFEADWVSEALDLPVKMVHAGFAQTRWVDAFNNHVGLPRWRDRALVAGSAVGLQVADTTLGAEAIWLALDRAERDGIGLRRGEGYGQIVVNHPAYERVAQTERFQGFSIAVRFPQGLLPGETADGPIARERRFRYDWERKLRSSADHRIEHAELVGVSRMLRSWRDRPLEFLREKLDRLGLPDLGALPGRHLGFRGDYENVPRKRKDFFASGAGHAAVEWIKDNLDQLEEMLQGMDSDAEASVLRAIGVGMLADVVAGAVQREQRKELPR